MQFNNFSIHAIPHIIDAYCRCGETLFEVFNGLASRALYCQKCRAVYVLKLVRVPKAKITPKYLAQCHEEVCRKKKKL